MTDRTQPIILPLLFTGTDRDYEHFIQQTGLRARDVSRVTSQNNLRGYMHRWWFVGYSYSWILTDTKAMQYAREHDIKAFRLNSETLFMLIKLLAKQADL